MHLLMNNDNNLINLSNLYQILRGQYWLLPFNAE